MRYCFGVMCMHFWYLWWCLAVGAITIVQCIFGALFLGLGCNIFLVLHLWCYALSAILRRLATAVAHLLYVMFMAKARVEELTSHAAWKPGIPLLVRGGPHITSAKIRGSWTPPPTPLRQLCQHLRDATLLKWGIFIC